MTYASKHILVAAKSKVILQQKAPVDIDAKKSESYDEFPPRDVVPGRLRAR